jgi:hypothetical protein
VDERHGADLRPCLTDAPARGRLRLIGGHSGALDQAGAESGRTSYQRFRIEGRNGLLVVIVQLARVLLPHLLQLTLIFLSVTALVLVLSDVANAVR